MKKILMALVAVGAVIALREGLRRAGPKLCKRCGETRCKCSDMCSRCGRMSCKCGQSAGGEARAEDSVEPT
jgi:hypothetical protein